jgi:hypothetical protein
MERMGSFGGPEQKFGRPKTGLEAISLRGQNILGEKEDGSTILKSDDAIGNFSVLCDGTWICV